jgi:hypothetical protein
MKHFLMNLFRKLTPLESAARELVLAEHSKLQAQTQSEWYAATVLFETRRIERLRHYLQEATK